MTKKATGIFGTGKSPIKLALTLSLPFILVLAALLAALVLWEWRTHEKELVQELSETAKAYFQQVIVTRLWNARHGGVYVAVTPDTPPNPYLNDPEREITSTKGKVYTKMNPSYMTRQISMIADDIGLYKFHMSSLSPLNPYNKPDAWEASMLRAFEAGVKEAHTFSTTGGREYFRYMAPLVVEESCLGCHAMQGYELGDVRGGLTISIPTDVPRAFHHARARRNVIAYSVVGFFAASFMIAVTWLLSKRIAKGIERELEHERLSTAMLLAGAAAHELRQPMAIISGFTELLKEKAQAGEPVAEEAEIIVGQCDRMNEIITRMLKITRYKTKSYADDTEIFDIEEGVGGKGKGEAP